MSTLITNKLVTKAGTIGGTTTPDIVDYAGNLKSSSQFIVNKIVDYAGNLGQITETGPWEMQLGTVETVGAHLGSIANNYAAGSTAATLLTGFASAGCIGYLNGVVSGTGTWTIQSGPQTIGGVSYAGGGLIIATAASTVSTTALQANSNLQLGNDINALTGSIRNVTIAAGATLDIFGANTSRAVKIFIATNAVGGTVNWKGSGICGQGILGDQGTFTNNGTVNIDDCEWALSTNLAGNGVINVLDGGTFHNNGIQAVGSTNQFNINGCGWCDASSIQQGAIYLNANTTFSPKVNVQSASCMQVGANASIIFTGLLTGSAPVRLFGKLAPVNGAFAFTNTANTYSGTMTVDGVSLNQSNGNSLQFAKIVLTRGGRIGSANTQTIGSIASTDSTTYWSSADFNNVFIKNNGATTFAGRLLWNGGSNAANFWLEGGASNILTLTNIGNTCNLYARNGSKVIMEGGKFIGANGQIRVSAGSTVSAGTSTTGGAILIYLDATSALDVRAVGASTGIINTSGGTSSLAVGWKVNLLDPLPAGTHVIWKNSGTAITSLPAIGTNLSGRTVTGFIWNNAVSPKTLSVTLI